jgi:C1A family cysteine protease
VPDPGGVFEGGHAVLVVGYDDKKKRFRFQNSWGTDWGARGFGYFTYDYMETHSWNSWGAVRL